MLFRNARNNGLKGGAEPEDGEATSWERRPPSMAPAGLPEPRYLLRQQKVAAGVEEPTRGGRNGYYEAGLRGRQTACFRSEAGYRIRIDFLPLTSGQIMKTASIFNTAIAIIIALVLVFSSIWVNGWLEESRVLAKVAERLSADTRIAEVLVTRSEYDELSQRVVTTIKFLEYDASGRPLPAQYFSFHGNVIQFQSLVVRFEDKWIRKGDKLRGKSAALFLKAFVLDGKETEEFTITPVNEIPAGYKIPGVESGFEQEIWENFWSYALDPAARERKGIKNVQIEAPGSIFVPGTIYSLKIEHDGGIRIDARPLPDIVKGEML